MTWRWPALLVVLALGACGARSPGRLQTLGPGAAACSVASQTNPAVASPGLGGTGAPVVRGPDPGGIGGTGQVASGPGLGGTGRPVVAGESGLGGTGIVGVVTGFASICVNGVEVEVEPSMPVDRGGETAPLSDLVVGQLVALQATGEGDQLRASRIAVIDAAVGPLTSVDAGSGRFQVMGQPAQALEVSDLQGLAAGDWVRVSGQRLSSGEIRATRVQRAAPGAAFVTGPYAATGAPGLRVGETPLSAASPPDGLVEGQEVAVRGVWSDGRLVVRTWMVQPTRAAMGASKDVLLQGYVHAVRGRELQLGYESLTLSEQLGVHGGGDLRALRVDQPVQVRGRVDDQRRVTVERIELRSEGRRGPSPRPADAAAPAVVPSGSDSSKSSTGGSAGNDSGRGRGRGRGGDSGSSGSGSSGSGGDSGSGRGRGRGGDSSSSGSGSSGGSSGSSGSSGSGSSGSGSSGSGSGSSGSGSSGSGSSGSSSSGSGDSGGDSGRGRGRGRGGRD